MKRLPLEVRQCSGHLRVPMRNQLSYPSFSFALLLALSLNVISPARTPGQDRLLDLNKIQPRGQQYEASVPDSLDLAEQGKLAINALTGHLEPDKFYGVYQSFTFDREPKLSGLTWNLPAKDARVLPMLRAMTCPSWKISLQFTASAGAVPGARRCRRLHTGGSRP